MKLISAIILAMVLYTTSVWADGIGDTVEVRIVTDSDRALPLYPAKARHPIRKAYAEAVKGEHYRIVVRNRIGRRIGVVVAVDGRNIISGAKSWLRNDERMYIIEPYATNEYSGWRTGEDHVNRFFFSDAAESYAAAFSDKTAVGVIAVAVYPEHHYEPTAEFIREAPMAPRNSERKSVRGFTAKAESDNAGTGYGRTEYSPSRTVSFAPEPTVAESIYIKYEWRSTLSRLGIIPRNDASRRKPNRLWDGDGFAPPPPER